MAHFSGNQTVKQGDNIVDLTTSSTTNNKKNPSTPTTALKEGDNIVDLTTSATANNNTVVNKVDLSETTCGAFIASAPTPSAIRGVYGLDFANYYFWGTPEHAVSEFPITKFKEWYKHLRLAKFLSLDPYIHKAKEEVAIQGNYC
jgi:hypothetical protein